MRVSSDVRFAVGSSWYCSVGIGGGDDEARDRVSSVRRRVGVKETLTVAVELTTASKA